MATPCEAITHLLQPSTSSSLKTLWTLESCFGCPMLVAFRGSAIERGGTVVVVVPIDPIIVSVHTCSHAYLTLAVVLMHGITWHIPTPPKLARGVFARWSVHLTGLWKL